VSLAEWQHAWLTGFLPADWESRVITARTSPQACEHQEPAKIRKTL
jgi:hypothetical protein